MLNFRRLHTGYHHAIGDSGHEFVIRTRPLDDGWMAIHNSTIVATGLATMSEAMRRLTTIDRHVLANEDRWI